MRPRLPAHLAYPYSHTPQGTRGKWDCHGCRSNVTQAAASSSTTACGHVIRPDRDMRQFDGSIV
jgi:hypothetical protein